MGPAAPLSIQGGNEGWPSHLAPPMWESWVKLLASNVGLTQLCYYSHLGSEYADGRSLPVSVTISNKLKKNYNPPNMCIS